MAERDFDQGFQVRDRRRRGEESSPSVEEHRPAPQEGGQAAPEPQAPPRERTLIGLFMMLASLAVAALEGVPDPTTGQTERDPQQAAELIDTLTLLREKTEGHRTAEETQMLEGLIYDLQLQYVQATTRS